MQFIKSLEAKIKVLIIFVCAFTFLRVATGFFCLFVLLFLYNLYTVGGKVVFQSHQTKIPTPQSLGATVDLLPSQSELK